MRIPAMSEDEHEVSTSTNQQVLDELEEILVKSGSDLHVPAAADDPPVLFCAPSTNTEAGWRRKSPAVFPGRADRVCDTCASLWVEFGKPDPGEITVPMSVRQREALCMAYEMGYFNQPRTSDLEEVGSMLNRSPATVIQQTRRAVELIVEATLVANQTADADLNELTDRQRDVIVSAYERGYFDWPRETGQDDIAAEYGLARSTISQHLRVGLRKLIEQSGVLKSDSVTAEK